MHDNFRGIIEQGCPLCGWFGMVGAFKHHWKIAHGFVERFWYYLKRL